MRAFYLRREIEKITFYEMIRYQQKIFIRKTPESFLSNIYMFGVLDAGRYIFIL